MPLKPIYRDATPEDRELHEQIRREIEAEFPPLDPPREPSFRTRVAIEIRQARLAAGLTYEEVAERARVNDPLIVRSVEEGRDVPLLQIEAVAAVLGLKLAVVSA
jgi:ribosome-binding protein aMBF1 (putative translation factor)